MFLDKRKVNLFTLLFLCFLFSCSSDEGDTVEGSSVKVDQDSDEKNPSPLIGEDLFRPFITTWKTDNSGFNNDNQITIFTDENEVYDYEIDWGDETKDANITGDITHTYEEAGIYTVSIKGKFPRIYNSSFRGNAEKLISIEQWGDIKWSSMEDAFFQCQNLQELKATDAPDLSLVSSLKRMFSFTSLFNGDLSNWDVSNIKNMEGMFSFATSFNGDLSDWNVSNVETMELMFNRATSFNGDLSNWDVSAVSFMGLMFSNAVLFNGDLSDWDVSNVIGMPGMFEDATSFNGDLSNWDVSKVRSMDLMFGRASLFNGDLSKWDVSEVQTMNSMFLDATSFDGNIGDWDVSRVQNMQNMFRGVSLSSSNYDSLLQKWSKLELIPDREFNAGNSQYSATAQAARNILINTFNWDINDGGLLIE